MFGPLLQYEQKEQSIILGYEERTAIIQVVTDKVINVFVPFVSRITVRKPLRAISSSLFHLPWLKAPDA